jgi:hypothetical protein
MSPAMSEGATLGRLTTREVEVFNRGFATNVEEVRPVCVVNVVESKLIAGTAIGSTVIRYTAISLQLDAQGEVMGSSATHGPSRFVWHERLWSLSEPLSCDPNRTVRLREPKIDGDVTFMEPPRCVNPW